MRGSLLWLLAIALPAGGCNERALGECVGPIAPALWGGDPSHESQLAADGPSSFAVRWQAAAGPPEAMRGLLVAADGAPLVVSTSSVVALDPRDGHAAPPISFDLPAPDQPTPMLLTLGPDGTIYLANFGQPTLLAIDRPSGQVRWRFDADCGLASSPLVARDGTVYVGCIAHSFALDPCDGHPLRTIATGSLEAIAPSGFLVGLVGEAITAISPRDGHVLWSTPWPDGQHTAFGAPTISPDGLVYQIFGSAGLIQTSQDYLLAVYEGATGHLRGSFPFQDPAPIFVGGLAMARDGTLYLVSTGTVRAFAAGSSRPEWETPLPSAKAEPLFVPAVDASGTLYVSGYADTGPAVWVLDPTGRLVHSFDASAVGGCGPLGASALYCARPMSDGVTLTAIGP